MANITPRKNKDGKVISYRILVYRGRDSEGKLLKHFATTFHPEEKWSEAKVQKELQKFVVEFENKCKGAFVVDSKQTFRQYAAYVLNLKESVQNKKHRTIKRYNELLERINLAIGHLKLTELRPQHLNQFYEMLSQDGANLKTGGPLSAKTILEHHRLIHTILKQAEKELLVEYNAATKATPPTCEKKEAAFLQISDIENVLFWSKNEPLKWQVVLNLLIFTGCRRGEIAGIKIENILFDENIIRIKNNLLYSSDVGVYDDSPKTKTSVRDIKIPKSVMSLVRKLALENKENILKFGNKWTYSGYLLTQENGQHMHPDSITDYCSKFSAKYNKIIEKENKSLPKSKQFSMIPHLNPHAFRHSQASILINSGEDIVTVSKRLGHALVSTTSDMYSHILEKADEAAANKLDEIFLKKSSSK